MKKRSIKKYTGRINEKKAYLQRTNKGLLIQNQLILHLKDISFNLKPGIFAPQKYRALSAKVVWMQKKGAFTSESALFLVFNSAHMP